MEIPGVGAALANLKQSRKQKAERSRKREAERSHKRWVNWGDANEQCAVETDGEGTASANPKQSRKRWVVKHPEWMMPLLHVYKGLDNLQVSDRSEGFVEKQRESDRSEGFVNKHTGRSITDIPEGGGGIVGMDIENYDANLCNAEVPDDSQARANVKVTEEKLGEGDWKETRKPKVKVKGKGKGKGKVTEEKLEEIPDDMATREREDWKENTKQGKEKEEEKPKPKRKPKKRKPKVKKLKERDLYYMDDRDQILLRALLGPELKWEEKVMDILHVVHCRGFTEYNNKMQCHVPTRFCLHNIAFFDLDKESVDVPWPPIHQIPRPLRNRLDDSVNVIAIKVAQSDRRGPLSIYGTVLARDEYDYRCIYLFRRGRDDPQLITSKDRTLTLISPVRALAVRDSMFFEFHLKIKGGDAADEDFSKGFIEHSAIRHMQQPTIKSLESCLSTMELVYTPVRCALEASITVSILKGPSDFTSKVKLVYTPVRCALEASITVSILKGPSDFTSKVIAWTTGNDENKIVLYDSEGAGTRTELGPGESVSSLVAVPLGEELVLNVSLADWVQHQPEECLTLVIGPDVDERTLEQGPYRMQVKISWKGVVNHRPGFKQWGRPNMWGYIAGHRVLLS